MERLKDVFNKEILIFNKEMKIIYSTLDDINLIQHIVENSQVAAKVQESNYISKGYENYEIIVQENMIEQVLYYIIKIKSLDYDKCIKDKNDFGQHEKQEILKNCIEIIREVLNSMTFGPYRIELSDEVLKVSMQLDELIALYMQEQRQSDILEQSPS